jgi:hypothetical protein
VVERALVGDAMLGGAARVGQLDGVSTALARTREVEEVAVDADE